MKSSSILSVLIISVSDDDLNGPLFYMRVLQDFGTSNISERQMGHTLLNYVGERHGFFWWGGYGTSTEETAYWNLLNGIEPPPFRFHRTKWKNNSRADRGTDFFLTAGDCCVRVILRERHTSQK